MKTQIHNAFRPRGKKIDQGFSLIEVMISMALITIGLLSLLGVFGYAMAATQSSQENATAKLLADEAMEGILTARETANISWTQINNTGSGGIFLPGFLPIDCAGADGIIGTADDAACGPQILEQPGPTGVYVGTCPPDACNTLTSFTRQILISPVIPPGGGPASYDAAFGHDHDPVHPPRVSGPQTIHPQHLHFAVPVNEENYESDVCKFEARFHLNRGAGFTGYWHSGSGRRGEVVQPGYGRDFCGFAASRNAARPARQF